MPAQDRSSFTFASAGIRRTAHPRISLVPSTVVMVSDVPFSRVAPMTIVPERCLLDVVDVGPQQRRNALGHEHLPARVVYRDVQADPGHELRRADAGGVDDRIGEDVPIARRDASNAVAALDQ